MPSSSLAFVRGAYGSGAAMGLKLVRLSNATNVITERRAQRLGAAPRTWTCWNPPSSPDNSPPQRGSSPSRCRYRSANGRERFSRHDAFRRTTAAFLVQAPRDGARTRAGGEYPVPARKAKGPLDRVDEPIPVTFRAGTSNAVFAVQLSLNPELNETGLENQSRLGGLTRWHSLTSRSDEHFRNDQSFT